ncbi:hypothetical protein Trydic_g21832, partial [Trypoxylus dichotomus]
IHVAGLEIQEKLNKQKEELDVQLNAKDVLINAYQEKIEVLKVKFKEDIKKRVCVISIIKV